MLGGGLFVVLAIWLAVVMPERGFSPARPEERQSWPAMAQTLQGGVGLIRVRPVLPVILGISVIFGMASEGYDRLWTPHILEDFSLPSLGPFKPVVWFGLMNVVSMFLTLGVAEVARRRIDTENQQSVVRALMVITALLSAGIVVFGLTTGFGLALVAFWSVGTLRATLDPLYLAWINQHTETKVRATILSINNLAESLGQIAGGPVIGAIAIVVSLRAALVVTGLLFTPALALYARTLRRNLPQTVLTE